MGKGILVMQKEAKRKPLLQDDAISWMVGQRQKKLLKGSPFLPNIYWEKAFP